MVLMVHNLKLWMHACVPNNNYVYVNMYDNNREMRLCKYKQPTPTGSSDSCHSGIVTCKSAPRLTNNRATRRQECLSDRRSECIFLSCKANARVWRKDGAWPAFPLRHDSFTKVPAECHMSSACDYSTLGSNPRKSPRQSMHLHPNRRLACCLNSSP